MPSVSLIDTGPSTLSWLEELSAEGVRLLETRAEEIAGREQKGESNDVVVIGTDAAAPMAIARTAHASSPDAHLVFLTDRSSEAALRRELMFAPTIGRHWSMVPVDAKELLVGTVRNALHRSSGRRDLRKTLTKLNTRLAEAPAPAPRRFISDHFIASVFDQLSDAVIMLDTDSRVLTANTAAVRAFGPALVAGEQISNLIEVPPEEGSLQLIELRRQNGESLVLEVRRESVHDPQQRLVGSTIVARDVTERKREDERKAFLASATAKLSETLDVKEAFNRLAGVVAESVADVCVIDVLSGDVVSREAAATSPTAGQDAAEILASFAPRNDAHPGLAALRRGESHLQNDVSDDDWRSLTLTEEHYQLVRRLELHSFLSVPLKTGERVLGALTLARGGRSPRFGRQDQEMVEELARRAAIALHNAWLYQAADEGNRAKDEFLATLSHELRTPMTSILGWVQLLLIGGLSEEEVADGLKVVHQSARVQAQLIDDLLDLSRIELGKLHLKPERLDVCSVLDAAIETLRPAIEAKELTLDSDISEELLITGDPNRLQQVFWNLLSNAVKFSPRGSSIRVQSSNTASRAQIVIEDQGSGIAPEFIPYVFDRFRQADGATTRRFGGLGLGLAIVKQIVELHGGTVAAESGGIGRGARFTVTLPIRPVHDTNADEAGPMDLVDLTGYRILVVEDDLASASMIRAVLRRAGAEVEVRHSVAEALDALRASLPHLVISDVAMPDEDGYALIRQMRGSLRIPRERVPAIALTALGDIATRVELLGAGFERHVRKPVDPHSLTACAAEVLDSTRSS